MRTGTKATPTVEFNSTAIVRFNADGSIDTTFQTNGTRASGGLNYIEDVTIDAQDRILCAGGFSGFRNSNSDPYITRYGIARLNADGSLDTGFQIDPFTLGVPAGSTNISGWFRRAITDNSGKIYISGELSWGVGFPKPSVKVFARLFSDGSVDSGFAPTLTDIGDFVIEPDGKVTATGSDNGATFFKRFNADGTVDPAFNFPGGVGNVFARPLRRSPSGQYLLAVDATHTRDKLIRVNGDGSIDASFDPVAVYNEADKTPNFGTWDVAPNGKIYSGSFFDQIEGISTNKIVAFEGDYVAASPGIINLALGSATVVENNGNFYAAITRTGGDSGAASVTLITSNGSASAGSDYTTVSTSVSWSAGESGTKYVLIPILIDGTQEPNENFAVTLSSPNGAILGSSSTGNVTILDIDSLPVITTQPQSQSTNAVQTVTFSVNIQSNSTVTFQWRINGSNITGATSSSYTTPSLAQNDSGNSYDVVITSSAGSVTSSAAILTVSSPDGTPDPSWTSSTTSFSGSTSVVLPDGTAFAIDSTFGQPQVIKKFLPNGTLDVSYTSPAFTQGGNNASVWSLALDHNGELYVRGGFDAVGGVSRSGLARLNADGSLDTDFAPDFAATHTIPGTEVFPTAQGLYLILKPTNQARGVARLTETGSIDTAFKFGNASFQNTFMALKAIQTLPDGKLLIGHLRGNGVSISSYGFTRLEADGDVDSTFNEISSTTGLAGFEPTGLIVLPDGSFFYSTRSVIGLANADGTADGSLNFNLAPNGNINSIALAKGKFIVGGAFTELGGTAVGQIARLNPDGSLDSSFPGGPGADGTIDRITTLSDGKLHIGGSLTTFNTASYPALVKLLMDDPAVKVLTTTPALENTGTLNITLRRSGRTDVPVSVDVTTASGSALENTDYTGINTTVSWTVGDAADKTIAITLLDDGDTEGTEKFSVNLSNPVGTAIINSSTAITIRDDEAVPSITVQPTDIGVLENGSATLSVTATSGLPLSYQWYFNGNIIIGATSSSYSVGSVSPAEEGIYHVVISTTDESITSNSLNLSIEPDPTLVSPLYANPATSPVSGTINVVVPAADGGAYIGGTFQDFDGDTALDYITKINEDGSIDSGFTPPTLDGNVYDIAMSATGHLYIVGSFTGRIIKLAADGTEDSTFSTNRGTGGDDPANAVDVLPDGSIVVGGDFRIWNGSTIAAFNALNSHLVHLNADGTLNTTRYPNPGHNNNYILNVDALHVLTDGRIMVAYNQSAGIYPKARIYNVDGTLDNSFSYPFSSKKVYDISEFPDGSYLFAGDDSLYQVSSSGNVVTTYDTSADWSVATIQLDGKVIGSRNSSTQRLQRFLTNNQLDPIFDTASKLNGNANSIALRNDGRLWAAGNFTAYDGTSYPNVVLLENHLIPLAIIGQPQQIIQNPGTSAAFTCEATGTTAISYQWRKNGVPLSDDANISGSSTTTLTIANIMEADEGDYTCEITNASGNRLSNVAKLIVLGAPQVISISQDTSVLEGYGVDFTVDAIGAGALSYQWQKKRQQHPQ